MFGGHLDSDLGHPRPPLQGLHALSQPGALLRRQRDQLEPERAIPAVRGGRRSSQGVGSQTVQGKQERSQTGLNHS